MRDQHPLKMESLQAAIRVGRRANDGLRHSRRLTNPKTRYRAGPKRARAIPFGDAACQRASRVPGIRERVEIRGGEAQCGLRARRRAREQKQARCPPLISTLSSLTEAPCVTLRKAYRETPKLAPWTAQIRCSPVFSIWEGTGGRCPEAQPSFTMSRIVFQPPYHSGLLPVIR